MLTFYTTRMLMYEITFTKLITSLLRNNKESVKIKNVMTNESPIYLMKDARE